MKNKNYRQFPTPSQASKKKEQGSVDLIQRSQPFKFSTSKHFVSSHVDRTLKIAAKRRAYYELIRKTSS